MTPTREAIYSALWDLIVNDSRIKGQFVTTSRFLTHFVLVELNQLPALFIYQKGEAWVRPGRGVSPKRTLRSELVMYTLSPAESDELASPLINVALDVVDDALNPIGTTPDNTQTLGGLVDRVWIAGEIMITEGLLRDASISITQVPLEIIVP